MTMKFGLGAAICSAIAMTAFGAGSALAADAKEIVKSLPPEMAQLYDLEDSYTRESNYIDFSAVPKPWKWCHSESYQGNPWRVAVTNELVRQVEIYKAKGWVSDFELADSNGDVSQQISQIRGFIDKKCSIITSIAGSATALNDVIKASYDAGIPFVTQTSSVTSPYAINVDQNYVRWGADMAQAIVDQLGNKGNILMVGGIAGFPIDTMERKGAESVFAKSDMKVLRTVNGDWTANVTKAAVLQALATIPQQVDAVWTSGSEVRVIAENFKQLKRPMPLITGSVSGDMLGYWKDNQDVRFYGTALGPSWMAQTLFRVGVRTLEGQGPKLGTLLTPLPVVAQKDLPEWYEDCMLPSSASAFPIAPSDPMPDNLMDAYFTRPAPIEGFDYAQTPSPCASN